MAILVILSLKRALKSHTKRDTIWEMVFDVRPQQQAQQHPVCGDAESILSQTRSEKAASSLGAGAAEVETAAKQAAARSIPSSMNSPRKKHSSLRRMCVTFACFHQPTLLSCRIKTPTAFPGHERHLFTLKTVDTGGSCGLCVFILEATLSFFTAFFDDQATPACPRGCTGLG